MNYFELYHKNMDCLKKNPYVGHFTMISVQRLEVEATGGIWKVHINDRQEVILYKNGTFDYEQLFLQNRKHINNLDKIYVLNALHTLLRKSEHCGYDNRVYLYYDDILLFHAMAAVVDFEPLLSDGQFMIVFRSDCFDKACTVKKVHVAIELNELQNIVLFYQPQSCGYEFFREIIQKSPYVVYADGWRMHRQLEEAEKRLGVDGLFLEYFLSEKEYAFDAVMKVLKAFQETFDEEDADTISQFEKMFGYYRKMSVSEIMKGLFLAKYYVQNHGCIDYGIVPVIVYFPDHYLRVMRCYDVVLRQFEHVIFFRLVRNPVVRTIRAYQFIKEHRLHYFAKFINVLTEELSFDEYSLNHGQSFSARFEDLKQNPDTLLPAVCNCFGIPFTQDLLDDPYVFREDALYAGLDRVFSQKDIQMLKLLYQDILKYYGYEQKNGTDKRLENIDALSGYAFGFETELAEILKINEQFVHLAVERKIADAVKRIGQTKFPVFISKGL